ncbi:Nudix family hydrolase [Xanthomonadaceae bacterium XH05]|nr:Nudix family hydrolase [Xanthomonadaceae bacterium XH05]
MEVPADSSLIHVVAGVLTDARGRVLLARRDGDRELAGLWEFPGGKVEPGESPRQALARELHEEIGVDLALESAEPLIAVPHRMRSGKRILLDVYRVPRYQGRARGMESQAVTWVVPDRLSCYSMPDADRPVVAALLQPDRCLVTPDPVNHDVNEFMQRLELALADGVRRIQLRSRALPPGEYAERAEAVAHLTARYQAQLLLNSGSADLETVIGLVASLGVGLHLTSADLARLDRTRVPVGTPLAASCHNRGELMQAQDLGVDFALLGPVKPTATHPDAVPLGFSGFAALREDVQLPIYALGGLSSDAIAQARAHGAQGIAAIRGLWPAD